MSSQISGDSHIAEDVSMEEDDYGSDIELDEELEGILVSVETEGVSHPRSDGNVEDIEDLVPRVSPFLEFRRKGWLSVSDLVGLLWCEVQVRAAS
jgi:exonuclease V